MASAGAILLTAIAALMLAVPAAPMPMRGTFTRCSGATPVPMPGRGGKGEQQGCPMACHAGCVRRAGDGGPPGDPDADA